MASRSSVSLPALPLYPCQDLALTSPDEPTPDHPNSFPTSQSWAASTYAAAQHLIASQSLNPSLQILTHDSFMGPTSFLPLLPTLPAPPTTAHLPAGANTTFALDLHNYQLFTPADRALDQPAHVAAACAWAAPLRAARAAGLPVYVGEWAALTAICVRADGSTVAGTACGAADGAGCQCASADAAVWNPQVVKEVRRFVEAQMEAFEGSGDGDFVWSFGGPGGWGVENLVRVGAWPRTRGERVFGRQC